jgi:hypothetical protein
MSVFFKKVRGEVNDNLSSRVPMLTLVEEERLVAERSMISLVVENPC